ncbi:pyrroloquinoline quinone biosynthesis protein PqqE [Methylocystis parvus]|uniref:PqqA peptide cyclase n=1 Tax=Methylocystis parvus TaxID=134 RepID=A0A6B8MCG0_9HYPH|nr:pyrroloquinoline quinone biosynthesis protein PqqE [Methylocystis parvus]QGM99003.1 pyrroloquinoline quinone biosynthesis protein PqqE [Methylocystis parvus]WBK00635.1 pyrroloquinoline quinone biosynthesis protein PqqE [Methylocystis parvus OBBP]
MTTSRYIIGPDSRPAFTRYARLHDDRARQRTVILAPERAYELDPIGLIVLKAIDGETTIAELCARLAAQYKAPLDVITRDVTNLLQGLADKRLLRDGVDLFSPPKLSDFASSVAPFAGGPAGLLAELTHRCPLQCPYCSNPLELEKSNVEMTAAQWGETFRQAASIGALQLHLSGGEPTARRDLEEILTYAVEAGLYTNLVTSAVLLTREKLERLARIGLDHVQVSIQDVVPESADRISAFEGGVPKKRDVARWTRELGMGLTINAPMHRQNIAHLPQIIDFAVEVDAQRIEIAHIQYYAWAQENRAALIPTRETFMETVGIVDAAKKRLQGVLNFDFVIHDHYATRPKQCTGGWGRSIMVVTPSGKALPCHAAQTIPHLTFDDVRTRDLGDIWRNGAAFNAYRGVEWMKEPCRSCDRREIDYGGCRCQALAVAGDAAATDPACHLSPDHARFAAFAETESHAPPPAYIYRRFGGAPQSAPAEESV